MSASDGLYRSLGPSDTGGRACPDHITPRNVDVSRYLLAPFCRCNLICDLSYPTVRDNDKLAATAARMSCLKAASLIFSPSRMSIARRTFASRLELKSFFGSLREAPRAKVHFTTCLYDSPVQTMPSWDQTGVPMNFHSS